MKVYLNPGHDRLLDSGAVNAALNLRECDLAYELAEAVQAYLERNGVAVVLGQAKRRRRRPGPVRRFVRCLRTSQRRRSGRIRVPSFQRLQ